METPIYKAIVDYINKDMSRFHMPGHKGKNIYGINDLLKYDITEIEGLDNLLESKGVIRQTEEQYRKIYQSKKTIITTQGSTLGVQIMLTAALMSLKGKARKVIMDRNAHISAINTMAFLDIEPIWLYPDTFINDYMSGVISSQAVEDKILSNPDADIVYITSPNYFGQMMDLKSIAKVCNKYHKLLLVDNAHGAHLKFVSEGLHPMDCGCSSCCDSLHKTLPALTGSGLVHCGDERLAGYLKKAQMMYSSTSPSYLVMLSIDLLLSYIYGDLKKDLKSLIFKINELKVFANEHFLQVMNNSIDPIKLVLNSGMYNCSTRQICSVLRDYKVEPEYASDYLILLICGMQNDNVDFKRLREAINHMNVIFDKIYKKRKINYNCYSMTLNRGLSIREAVFCESQKVRTVKSKGCISAGSIVISPPGIPIITPGEIISGEAVDLLISKEIYLVDIVK